MFKLTDVVKHLLIINVLVFLASRVLNVDLLALHYPGSDKFQPFQIATHFFMHANLAHLFFNMFALVMFGSALEMLWGAKKFLFFYFVCAFGAAVLHMGYEHYNISQLQSTVEQFSSNPTYENYWAFFDDVPLDRLNPEYRESVDQVGSALRSGGERVVSRGVDLMRQFVEFKMDIPVVGASGAIYGLLLAFGMYFPNAELMLIFLPIPIKAKYFIPFLMLAELYLGVNQFSWDNIAHFAHLGGALTGFLLILYWRKFGD
ncbi:MAG: rhomboid family intramembrane serine protease [Saprospiraceae bacterium]|nr:rhomboid family intramembrane serine protease [Saprospiraceae bacterium]